MSAPDFPAPDRTAELSAGPIAYRDFGSGEPLLFVHGLLVDGRLWRKPAPLLAADHRCIVPDLPMGAHRRPMNADADLSPAAIAGLLAELIAELDLDRVTVIGNDSGGAVSQILAAERPELVDRLVLTPCDAFEVFPPAMFKPLIVTAKLPGGLAGLLQLMRLRPMRHSPAAFGWLLQPPLDADLIADWVRPAREDAAVRRDAIKFMRGAAEHDLTATAERLGSFDRPALVAWAAEDRFFKEKLGRRLAAAIPGARFELIAGARTFVSEDQPQALADLISEFAGSTA